MHFKFKGGILSSFGNILHTVHEPVKKFFENLVFDVDTEILLRFRWKYFKNEGINHMLMHFKYEGGS